MVLMWEDNAQEQEVLSGISLLSFENLLHFWANKSKKCPLLMNWSQFQLFITEVLSAFIV